MTNMPFRASPGETATVEANRFSSRPARARLTGASKSPNAQPINPVQIVSVSENDKMIQSELLTHQK